MKAKWSWVTGGVALGVWNILIFLSGNHLGTTTAYAQTTGYVTQFFSDSFIPVSSWTAGTCGGSGTLQVGWQWMLVLGVFLGGLLGRVIHGKGTQEVEKIPETWVERFGNRPKLRLSHAFIGGFIMLIGSRLAGGCTSSHIISGMSQMAVSGLLFGAAVFASGIPTAILLYRRRNRA
jgi:uncharacterized protein